MTAPADTHTHECTCCLLTTLLLCVRGRSSTRHQTCQWLYFRLLRLVQLLAGTRPYVCHLEREELVSTLLLSAWLTMTVSLTAASSQSVIIVITELIRKQEEEQCQFDQVFNYGMLFPFLPPGDTFSSSSSSTTPMGSQGSLSSHSSEKNGLSPSSPPSSPAADLSSSSTAPAAPSCSPSPRSSCEKNQKQPTEKTHSPHSSSQTSSTSQLPPAQQTSSVSSSLSSLISAERTVSVKGSSTVSLSSVQESRSPSTSPDSSQRTLVQHASSLRNSQPPQRSSSVSSLKSIHWVNDRNASNNSTLTETRVTNSTSPSLQHNAAFRTASSSSSSSSSLFPYQISTCSSLTSLHISEGVFFKLQW